MGAVETRTIAKVTKWIVPFLIVCYFVAYLDRVNVSFAAIMPNWGIMSGAMAFIPAIADATGLGNENTFYLLRVLLGAAEAGFLLGIIIYLTSWFPAQYRPRIVGYFMAAIPLSTVIGAPHHR